MNTMINNKTIPKECKGCLVQKYCSLFLKIMKIKNNQLKCPCMTCLVKTTCLNECDEYEQFHFQISNKTVNKKSKIES